VIPGNGSPKSDVSTVGSKSTQRLAGSSGRVAGYGTSSRNMSIAGITRLMNAVPSRCPTRNVRRYRAGERDLAVHYLRDMGT